jgi:hypothetical protein
MENIGMRIGNYVRLLSLVAATAVAFTACSDDPTDEGAGDAFAIVTNKSITTLGANESFTVTAQVVDRAGTPLPIQVTVSSAKTDVVANDSTRYVAELQETRIYGRTLKVDASAPLILTAGALTDTVEVKVLSGPFPGTVATAQAVGGTVLQFTSTTNIFDANTSVVVSGTSEPGFVVDITPTRARYILPFGNPPGPVTYAITNAGPADFSLNGSFTTTAVVPCADSYDTPSNNAPGGATTGALVPNGTVFGAANFSNDTDDFYKVTITEAGNYRFTVDWSDGADTDLIVYRANGSFLSTSGATSAKPEVASVNNVAAGDYFVQINMYDGAGGACTTYKLSVIKL